MIRMSFNSIFRQNEDGNLETLHKTRVGGFVFEQGLIIYKGISFWGIDLTQFIGRDLEIETDKDVLVIRGIY